VAPRGHRGGLWVKEARLRPFSSWRFPFGHGGYRSHPSKNPLVNVYITMEITIFAGKSTISMAIFNSYVCLPEGRWIFHEATSYWQIGGTLDVFLNPLNL